MNNKILVLAYPGTGKTYIADNYAGVSDLEFQHYRYDYGKYKNLPIEQLKGRIDIRTPRPDWPNNFYNLLKEELDKRKCVFVPMSTTIFSLLEPLTRELNVRVILAIQSEELLDPVINTFKSRGNSEEFILRRKNDFVKFHNLIKDLPYEKLYLKQNEYLIDALNNIGISFSRGKGYKNYI